MAWRRRFVALNFFAFRSARSMVDRTNNSLYARCGPHVGVLGVEQAVERVLEAFEARSRREWSSSAPFARGRDSLLLSVGRAAGSLLNLMVRESGARRILELGTSYGYSTVWLAEAAQAVDGKVISLDVADYKQAEAARSLAEAGLEGRVEFHTGDALEIIPRLEGPFDFVLLDIWKDLYVPSLELLFPKLAPGAIVVADNMLRPVDARPDALAYRRLVRSKPGMSSVLLPIGQGLEVSRLAGPDDTGL
jgi:predicted O-methyltransferase YrrM